MTPRTTTVPRSSGGPMPGDPPVRPDGLCVVCLEPRRPERSRTYGGAAGDVDPFCSTDCCRIWHGTPAALPDGPSRWGVSTARCSTCAVPVDELTPGCKACVDRHRTRITRERES